MTEKQITIDIDSQIYNINIKYTCSDVLKLGGFVNNETNVKYLHCFSQTSHVKEEKPFKLTRETQTVIVNTKSQVTKREFSTQTPRPNLFIDDRKTKVLYPKKYFTSEMYMEQLEFCTRFIQKMIRGWLARNKVKKIKQQKEDIKREQLKKEEEFRKSEELRHEEEIRRRVKPLSKADFDVLYEELQLWRISETNKIKEEKKLTEEKKAQAIKLLLEKEIELLQTIDRLKIQASKENKKKRIEDFLKEMSAPKRWKRSDGRDVLVKTPFTFRNEELTLIFDGLCKKDVSIDERLDILMNTKFTLFDNPSELVYEIEELINREADMINRGRSSKSLEGLRLRLCNLFFQFIQDSYNNPEASKHKKIPLNLINN